MQWIAAFIAGFLATLVFHQGVFYLFHTAGLVAAAPWNMAAVPPLGVPAVISLAFWGGVWGLPLWALMRGQGRLAYWLRGVVLGAIGPTAVAMLLVFPLKGLDVSAKVVVGGLIVNAAWGLGVAVFMKLFPTRS